MVTRRSKSQRKPAGAASKIKDPRGGLTQKGRAWFHRSEGANLKPGVKKESVAEMTPAEVRRKGSWAVRFYGRKVLPALRNADGTPTRFALTAAAWGEPVPKTRSAARKIAQKGHRLLAKYAKDKKSASTNQR